MYQNLQMSEYGSKTLKYFENFIMYKKLYVKIS